MIYCIHEGSRNEEDNKTASVKPREDIAEILVAERGAQLIEPPSPPTESASLLRKLSHQLSSFIPWKNIILSLKDDDVLVVQYPPIAGCFSFGHALRRYGKAKHVILLLHDIESLRGGSESDFVEKMYRLVAKKEEGIALRSAWKVISHNRFMNHCIAEVFGLPASKIVSLGLFDYLIPDDIKTKDFSLEKPIAIAGNLSKKKAGYIECLPREVTFNLYGPNYPMYKAPNLNYYGSFDSSDLPNVIEGSFGLVWDGPSADSCVGSFGEYLKLNNPHKASLYLSMGLPIVVWSKSAIAELVVGRGIGVAIDSLSSLPVIIGKMSCDEYRKLRKNASILSEQLRSGMFTLASFDRCISR